MSTLSLRRTASIAVLVLGFAGPCLAEGAVARGEEGRVGLSYNYRSRREAEDRALRECGGGSCRIVGRFDRACAAIATGRRGGYGWATRNRPGEAERAAIETCESEGNRGCSIVTRGCDDR